jgi:hypothetical protein
VKALMLLVAVLAAACGAPVDSFPADPDPAFIYSHTVQGDGAGCGFIYTTDPRVMLKCEPCSSALSSVCEYDGHTVVDVYALPGAGDGTPFGIASYVEFNAAACTTGAP